MRSGGKSSSVPSSWPVAMEVQMKSHPGLSLGVQDSSRDVLAFCWAEEEPSALLHRRQTEPAREEKESGCWQYRHARLAIARSGISGALEFLAWSAVGFLTVVRDLLRCPHVGGAGTRVEGGRRGL